jgi:drug/metabolite transporter (DMT)-like permease
MSRRTVLAFALIGLLWGSAWIPTSEVLKHIPLLRAGAIRFAIAAVFTALFSLAARLGGRPASPRFSAALFRDASVLSITALALPYALTAWASPRLSPGVIPVGFAFMPLIALLMSEELSGGSLAALVIGISGVILLVAQGLSFSLSQLGGIFVLLCAVILGAFSLIYAKKHLRSSDLVISSALQFAFAAILLGAISFATDRTAPSVPDTSTIVWIVVLGILISGTTLPFLYWLLTEVKAWQAATLQWISTLIAVAEAALLLRVGLSPSQTIGAACIIGSAFWLLFRRDAVTPPATMPTIHRPNASDSEVGSK